MKERGEFVYKLCMVASFSVLNDAVRLLEILLDHQSPSFANISAWNQYARLSQRTPHVSGDLPAMSK